MNRIFANIAATLIPLICTAVLLGCDQPLQLHARIVDSGGKGIAGALFYAEAWQYHGGAYDFVWGVADSSGNVHSSDGGPMVLTWRSDARLGVAAIAPGKQTFAVNDYTNVISPNAIEIMMSDSADAIMKWEPKLAKLGFPFEEKMKLADRLKEPVNLPLLQRFASAYRVLESETLAETPEEAAKMAFLSRLLAGNPR